MTKSGFFLAQNGTLRGDYPQQEARSVCIELGLGNIGYVKYLDSEDLEGAHYSAGLREWQ